MTPEYETFLETLIPGGPWTLSAIPVDSTRLDVPTAYVTSKEQLRAWVAEHLEHFNLYYQPNKTLPVHTKAKVSTLAQINALHVDIDSGKNGQRLTTQEQKDQVIQALEAFETPGPPSLIVDTGNGIQAVWKIQTEPSSFMSAAREMNAALVEALGGDRPCINPVHLCRLPGTINHPTAKKLKLGLGESPTRLIKATEVTYESWEFPRKPVLLSTGSTDFEIGPAEEITETELASCVSKDVLQLIFTGAHPDKNFPSRSEAVFSAICSLARADGVTDEQIKYIVTNPDFEISAHVLAQTTRTPEQYADRQIARAHMLVDKGADSDFFGIPCPSVPVLSGSKKKEAPADIPEFLRNLDFFRIPPTQFYIRDWLQQSALIQIVGPPKTYKSFFAWDMMHCIATGIPWYGIPTTQATVLYVLGEGRHGVRDRATVWQLSHGFALDKQIDNFWLYPQKVQLDDIAVGKSLEEFAKKVLATIGKPDIFVFDTLNRNMQGNENEPVDMSRVVSGCDLLCRFFDASVVLIHHTGHSVTDRGRGSSVLPGSVDMTLVASRFKQGKGEQSVNGIDVVVSQSKDGPSGQMKRFLATPVAIDDPETEGRSSIVLTEMTQFTEKATNEYDTLLDLIVGWDETDGKLNRTSLANRTEIRRYDLALLLKDMQGREHISIDKKGVIKATMAGVEYNTEIYTTGDKEANKII